ncbi:MAG TPA: replicative DNA helicase [Phycisphaerae bacterium]|nr:replicative DNA helicase [Phycisphaerae bacterium]
MTRIAPPPTPALNRPTPGVRTTDPAAAGKLPPQDLEAEISLLGSMLLDRDSIGLVLQIIPRDQSGRFYRADHRLLFETLIDLYDVNKPIDLIVLEDELRKRGLLEEVGGRDYLVDLCESVPSAANSEYYARIVRDKGLLRDLIQCSHTILQSAYDDQEEASHILDAAEKHLFEVTEQRVSNQAVAIRDFLDETMRQIETLQEGALTGVATGFTELDSMLGGMQHGDFVVIAARPSMGKTALGLSMLEYIGIVESLPAAFFSMEMSKLQIAQRMLCSHAQLDLKRLRHGKLSEAEKTKLKLICGNMRNYKLFIDDTPGMSVMELRAKARRLKMLHDIKVVFVDYLQLMFDRASKENRQQEISAISRGLKSLARELNIPVVALAQLNRQVEGREGNRPRMSDLRESGAIEQDADVVILLHREEYYLHKKKNASAEFSEQYNKVKGKAELIVAKQRNGPTGDVELHFNPEFTRFDNAAPAYLDDGGAYTSQSYDAIPDVGPMGGPEDEGAPF